MYDIKAKAEETLKSKGVGFSDITIHENTTALIVGGGTVTLRIQFPGRPRADVMNALNVIEFQHFILCKPRPGGKNTAQGCLVTSTYDIKLKPDDLPELKEKPQKGPSIEPSAILNKKDDFDMDIKGFVQPEIDEIVEDTFDEMEEIEVKAKTKKKPKKAKEV